MATRTWNIKGKTADHAVCLDHNHWRGTVALSVDGTVIFRKPMGHGVEHKFTVDGTDCVFRVRLHGWEYTYELVTGGDSEGSPEMKYVDFKCPHCGKPVSFPDRWIGRAQECPNCYQVLIVPSAGVETGGRLPIPIKTQRLLIRHPVKADAGDLQKLLDDRELWRYDDWAPGNPEKEARDWIESAGKARLFEDGHCFATLLELLGQAKVIGFLTLAFRDEDNAEMYFNMGLNRRYQGSGLGTEAVCGAMKIAFEGLNIRRLVARCDSRNISAARMLEKAGLRKEGHFVKNHFLKGEWADTLHYGLLREEYNSTPPNSPLNSNPS